MQGKRCFLRLAPVEEKQEQNLRFEQAKKHFLQGYESEMDLEPDYEKKLELMRSFCNLYTYARLLRCTAEEVAEAPAWMCNLRGRLIEKITYLENIVDKKRNK